MTRSLALVPARDEFLQCLPSLGQVAAWEPFVASQAPPQPEETFRVTGKPHCAADMREFGLKVASFPVGNRGGVGTLRQAHGSRTDMASRAVGVPVGSRLQRCLRAGAGARGQRPYVKVLPGDLEDERRVREDETVELARFFLRASEEHHSPSRP